MDLYSKEEHGQIIWECSRSVLYVAISSLLYVLFLCSLFDTAFGTSRNFVMYHQLCCSPSDFVADSLDS